MVRTFIVDGAAATLIGVYLDEGSKHFRVTGNVIDTRSKWLNVNTAGKMYRRRISTDNLATGNWHNSPRTGGRWLAPARVVIDKAGPRPASEVAP
jgi:hypothetical protein